MKQKNTFKLILAMAAILLIILPFVTTFNSFLTEVINGIGLYKTLQATIVPFESRIIVLILGFLRIPAFLAPIGERAAFFMLKGSVYIPVELQWNCLGWQSILLLTITFLVGYQGRFTKLSMMEGIIIGVLGTFLVNIVRMVFITAGLYYQNTLFAGLIHDYFAALTTIVWLVVFWWFNYRYVLEQRRD